MARRKKSQEEVSTKENATEEVLPYVEEVISVEKIDNIIEAEEVTIKKPSGVYKNTRRGPFVISDVRWNAGEEKATPEILLTNKQFLHAVKLKFLVEV